MKSIDQYIPGSKYIAVYRKSPVTDDQDEHVNSIYVAACKDVNEMQRLLTKCDAYDIKNCYVWKDEVKDRPFMMFMKEYDDNCYPTGKLKSFVYSDCKDYEEVIKDDVIAVMKDYKSMLEKQQSATVYFYEYHDDIYFVRIALHTSEKL